MKSILWYKLLTLRANETRINYMHIRDDDEGDDDDDDDDDGDEDGDDNGDGDEEK